MNHDLLVTKAALLYLALMFPTQERQQLLDAILHGSVAHQEMLQEPTTVEVLARNGRNFVEGFMAALDTDDALPDEAVLLLLDLLLDDRTSTMGRLERCRLLATLQMLCEACQRAFGTRLLADLLQRAYSLYRVVAGRPDPELFAPGQTAFGAYITADCLDEQDFCLPDRPTPTEMTAPARQKLPKFWKTPEGNEERLLRAFYEQLTRPGTAYLFAPEDCPVENFLALFENVPGYELREPLPFNARLSLEYWGVFLSAIYPGRKGYVLNDGTHLKRSSANGQEPSISALAMRLVRDQNGTASNSPSTFDKGSGNSALGRDERARVADLFTEMLRRAYDATRSGSQSHELLKKLYPKKTSQ